MNLVRRSAVTSIQSSPPEEKDHYSMGKKGKNHKFRKGCNLSQKKVIGGMGSTAEFKSKQNRV